MFALAQSAFKPNKLLVKLLISKQAKAALMVSVIHFKSALETDSILKHLSVGLPSFKKKNIHKFLFSETAARTVIVQH